LTNASTQRSPTPVAEHYIFSSTSPYSVSAQDRTQGEE
jgi:hypothetical protein